MGIGHLLNFYFPLLLFFILKTKTLTNNLNTK
jgi:hypothetical protein